MTRELVLIEWLDAISAPKSGWKSVEKVSNAKPAVIKSVGWVLKRTKTYVILVSSLTDDGDCDGDTVIPVSMLTKVTRL